MSAVRFVRVTSTRIACPHEPALTLVRFDFDRSRRRFVIQLADIEAPELGPSERSYACLVAVGVASWRRGANGLRGCDDSFAAAFDGEGSVRDILVKRVGDERISMRVELWDSLGWIQLEAAACRAYLRGSYSEPGQASAFEQGVEPSRDETGACAPAGERTKPEASKLVHRDLYTGELFDPDSPFDALLVEG